MKTYRTVFFSLLSLLAFSLLSCSGSTETDTTNDQDSVTTEATVTPQGENTSEEPNETPSSRYNYDQDWGVFKKAVLDQDIRGVGAFASSDAVDSEALISSLHADEEYIKILKATTYDDLKVTEGGDGSMLLEFAATVSGSDEEGNEYESGIFVYFSQGDPSLLLEYYMAAG